MISLSDFSRLFQIELYKLYHDKNIHVLTCFDIYVNFLREYCNDPREEKRYGQFDAFQIEDMKMSICNDRIDTSKETLESFWLYTRRGGKTKNLTVVAVFFALLGYLVMWRSSFTDQLNMAKFWFVKNPFVRKVAWGSKQNEVRIVNSPEINFDVISEGKTQSRGVDVVILDEECLIVVDSKKHDVYEKLRPCLADSKFKHFIHGTTPEMNTVAELNYYFLKDQEIRNDVKLVAEHSWEDCSWISPEFIETERLLHADDPYYVAMQYELEWTVAGGKVFNNVIREGDPQYPMFPRGYLKKVKPEFGGVDFNGDTAQHYLVLINYDDNFVYVLREIQFLDLNELFKYERLSLELEDGLFNDQFTEQTKRMGLRCIYNKNWKDADKMIKVQELRNRKIIINKKECPLTYKNLKDCAWNRHKTRTEIVKTTTQHGLDALLHAMHEKAGDVYVKGYNGMITPTNIPRLLR